VKFYVELRNTTSVPTRAGFADKCASPYWSAASLYLAVFRKKGERDRDAGKVRIYGVVVKRGRSFCPNDNELSPRLAPSSPDLSAVHCKHVERQEIFSRSPYIIYSPVSATTLVSQQTVVGRESLYKFDWGREFCKRQTLKDGERRPGSRRGSGGGNKNNFVRVRFLRGKSEYSTNIIRVLTKEAVFLPCEQKRSIGDDKRPERA
jgi:hypothetical protein